MADPANDVSHIDADGGTKTCPSTTAVTVENTMWGDNNNGWHVVNSNVTIDSRFNDEGEIHLILADGCTLNAEQEINIGEDDSLTIYARSVEENMGKQTAAGAIVNDSTGTAGIGSDNISARFGTIINGGIVTPRTSPEAAQILAAAVTVATTAPSPPVRMATRSFSPAASVIRAAKTTHGVASPPRSSQAGCTAPMSLPERTLKFPLNARWLSPRTLSTPSPRA
ncbi:MAG TPA: hypothetical protein H9835_05190 [Candidatus Agathobaculum merdigallinarum]|nr:hypothetical protein [Candidatus Agathobaculum merdigallinarum]